jgi:hypothetical protein
VVESKRFGSYKQPDSLSEAYWRFSSKIFESARPYHQNRDWGCDRVGIPDRATCDRCATACLTTIFLLFFSVSRDRLDGKRGLNALETWLPRQ